MAHSGWIDADETALLAMLQKKHCGHQLLRVPFLRRQWEQCQMAARGCVRLWLMMALIWWVCRQIMPLSKCQSFPLLCFQELLTRIWIAWQWGLPKGLTLREWSRTKFAFGNLERSGKTYRAVDHDDEYAGYRRLCVDHLGRPSCGPTARDWRSFLCACHVIEDAGLGVNKSKTQCFPGSNVPRDLAMAAGIFSTDGCLWAWQLWVCREKFHSPRNCTLSWSFIGWWMTGL